jgi:hypothetical protein
MTIQSLIFSRPKSLDLDIIPTFDKLLEFITSLDLDESIKVLVIQKVRKMPPGTYNHFIKNVNHYIESVRK